MTNMIPGIASPFEQMERLSEKRAEPPTDGQVTNQMLMAATQWPVRFDLKHAHLRCMKCQQSILAMGKNGQGYQTTCQDIMGMVVMHMIQVHQYTREGKD
jgi:hypothetical protein